MGRLKILLAAAVVAGVGVGSVGAARESGATTKVPAPAVGKATMRTLTVKVVAAAGKKAAPPKVRLLNAAALGKGFGGVTVTAGLSHPGSTATYKITFIMFMGNLSRSPASTQTIQLSPPAGSKEKVEPGASTDESSSCSSLKLQNKAFEGDYAYMANGTTYVLGDYVPDFVSNRESFLDGIVSFLWPAAHCAGTPEAEDPGDE